MTAVATNHTDKKKRNEASGFAKQLGKRHDFDVVEEEIFVCMLRTIDLVQTRSIELFEKHRISGPLYNALRIVGGEALFSEEGITVGTIASRLICKSPDTTRLVNRLQELGYVCCVTCPNDARRRMVQITEQGRKVLRELHRPIREMHRKHFGVLNAAEQGQLFSLLEKVRRPLSQSNDQDER